MPLQPLTTLPAMTCRQGETLEQYRLRFVKPDGTTPWSIFGATIVVTLRAKHSASSASPVVTQWTTSNGKLTADNPNCAAAFAATSDEIAALSPATYELAVGVVAYTGAAHDVATATLTVIAAGASFAGFGAATPTPDPQTDLTVIVDLPSIPIPDDATNADSGYELNSLVFGDMNSQLWVADPAIGATSPPREYLATDGAMTAPTGVKAGESYTLNLSRTVSSTSRVGRRFKTPIGCDSVTFEFHASRFTGDAGPEKIVMAIYASDATTLIASQIVTLGANPALCQLVVPVAGNTEYMACVWVRNAALGTQDSLGGTSARGTFSRCRVVPSGAGMAGVLAGDFWGIERIPWPYTADTLVQPPRPRGWGTGPYPSLSYPNEAFFGEKVNFAPMVLRCLGHDAAVEYVWEGSSVAAWGSPLVRIGNVGASDCDEFSAPTSLPILQTARTFAAIPLSGDGPRLLSVACPQTSRITRAYIGAYLGSQVEPAPSPARVLTVVGDSISVGYQIASSDGAFEKLRAVFPGLLIKYGAGGSSLASLGYVGAGGVLDPALAAVRDATNATITDTLPQPTEILLQLGTNDWGTAGVSAANYQIGVEGLVDWFRGQFPTATVKLAQSINRDGETVPNAGGATLQDYRDVMVAVAAARSPWCTTFGFPAVALADGTHPTAGGYATMAATLIAELVP